MQLVYIHIFCHEKTEFHKSDVLFLSKKTQHYQKKLHYQKKDILIYMFLCVFYILYFLLLLLSLKEISSLYVFAMKNKTKQKSKQKKKV